MVSIYVAGKDKTKQLSDWEIRWDANQNELKLICHFLSGKRYCRPLSECEVTPSRDVHGMLIADKEGAVCRETEHVTILGEKYGLIRYPNNQKMDAKKLADITLVPATTLKNDALFHYFVAVAKARSEHAISAENKLIADNVVRQFEKVLPHANTVLHAYCKGQMQERVPQRNYIYPFGINESQLKAVEHAFTSQISLIEGPPGTGKTQTILNIIANILLRGESVAILSNNNAAVENVYEKLAKHGLDHVVAKLGNDNNRKAFFKESAVTSQEELPPRPSIARIQTVLATLKQQLRTQNEMVQLQAEIDELQIEKRYLHLWQSDNKLDTSASLGKYTLTPAKAVELMVYLAYINERKIQKITLKDRIELLLNHWILRMKPFSSAEQRNTMIYALQLHYYEQRLQEKKAQLAILQEMLKQDNFTALLNELTNSSMIYLKHHLREHIPAQANFDAKNYRQQFDDFIKRYPIIGSGTHSIVNSIGKGAVLDYVIIDEASQQDIVPGVLAFGIARNLIVVGDSKQLAHIPSKLGIPSPHDFYDCEKYSLLTSCMGVFNDSLPRTLLKEHYRCHPRIIQFCNQQFYENQLIPMRQDNGEQALALIVTARGNHTRNNSNLRELDSVLKVLEMQDGVEWDKIQSRGFIAPFRAQVKLSDSHLPCDFINDTVHKFQGREREEIVFSTVLDKKQSSQRKIGFVDDARMINVAVSRAQHKFTLVTGDDVFTTNNGHIAALVRYMEYYADKKQIHRAIVVSAFDLLYKEYDQSLQALNERLRPTDSKFKSEQIIAHILRTAMPQEPYQALMFHSQIALNQLAAPSNDALTEREQQFLRNRASCDFVIYFKVGKTPLGVIEVDSDYHDTPEQAERDALKNSILAKVNIPLLRLRTIESHIEEKVTAFLAQWARKTN